MSAGGPRLFRHARAPDNSSPSRLQGIHVGSSEVQRVAEVCCGALRRNVVDQTADGEDGLVLPSRAVRNPAIYELDARERAQQRGNAAFGSNGT